MSSYANSLVAQKLLRTGDVYANEVVSPQADQLRIFSNTILGKNQWYIKILDQSDLAEKWLKEAHLSDDPGGIGVIRELKTEARRIRMLDHSIRLVSPHLPFRPVDWTAIHAAVTDTNLYLRTSKHGIRPPRLYEDVGICIADDVVPALLHQELIHELDALAATEPKDFHPGSSGKVQDLIHPSLYPYMVGSTQIPNVVKLPHTVNGKFSTRMRELGSPYGRDVAFASAYAWIPSVFSISEDGQDVSLEGYINGLGAREQYPALFRLIEEVFKIALPMLEHSASFDHEKVPSRLGAPECYERFMERCDLLEERDGTVEQWKSMLVRHREEREREQEQALLAERQSHQDMVDEKAQYRRGSLPAGGPTPSIWAGQKLKVVVKAANYILEPGENYTGTWHIEGMPHERIVASAIYYYERDDSIIDAGLYLRRRRDGEDDWPSTTNSHRDLFVGAVVRPGVDDEAYNSLHDQEFEHDSGDEYYISTAPSDFGSDANMDNLPAFLNVGVVPTTNTYGTSGTGRIVAFPNWVQHRVPSVSNAASTGSSATRKILCFFLVDDTDKDPRIYFPGFIYQGLEDITVLTSSDVPSQARVCNVPTLAFLLSAVCRRYTRDKRALPSELVDIIISHLAADSQVPLGISREDAEKRRRTLMEDRKVQTKNVNGLWEVEYSLCEH